MFRCPLNFDFKRKVYSRTFSYVQELGPKTFSISLPLDAKVKVVILSDHSIHDYAIHEISVDFKEIKNLSLEEIS